MRFYEFCSCLNVYAKTVCFRGHALNRIITSLSIFFFCLEKILLDMVDVLLIANSCKLIGSLGKSDYLSMQNSCTFYYLDILSASVFKDSVLLPTSILCWISFFTGPVYPP